MTAPANSPESPVLNARTTDALIRFQAALGRDPNSVEHAVWTLFHAHGTASNQRTLSSQGFVWAAPIPDRSGFTTNGSERLDLGNGMAVVVQHAALQPIQKHANQLDAASIASASLIGTCAAGARPVAFLHSLCLGELSHPETRGVLASVITGMADYSNRCGAPGLGGSLTLDDRFQNTPVFQSFCVGVMPSIPRPERETPSSGSRVFYAGSPWPDPEAPQAKGCDAFLGSRLCEAALELHAQSCVHAIEALGQGGLAAAAATLVEIDPIGVEIDSQRIPGISPMGMPPEWTLSPRTESLLILVRSGQEPVARKILEKWEIPYAEIGSVTSSDRLVVRQGDQSFVDIPTSALREPGTPSSSVAAGECATLPMGDTVGLDSIPDDSRPIEDLTRLLSWPAIASKNWLHTQFDQTVGNGSVVCPGANAAVIRIESNPQAREVSSSEVNGASKDSDCFLAMTSDGNLTSIECSPFEGGRSAVTEAAGNLACAGAVPWCASIVLSSPAEADPGTAARVGACVQGVSEACLALASNSTRHRFSLRHLPTTNPLGIPSLAVNMIGIIERLEHVTTGWFKNDGDAIIVLGDLSDSSDPWAGLGGSAYLHAIHGKKTGSPPKCDLSKAKNLHTALVGLIQSGGILSAHPCSAGGLAVALAKACISGRDGFRTPRLLGASVDLSPFLLQGARVDALLFGEIHSRILVSCAPLDVGKILERARILDVPAVRIGTVGGEQWAIRLGDREYAAPVHDLHRHWWDAISIAMQ